MKYIKKNIRIEDILELHYKGYTDKEIASQLNCQRSNITARLNKLNITARKSKINNVALRNRISETLRGRYTGTNNPNYNGNSTIYQVARGITRTYNREILRNREHIYCEICGKEDCKMEVHHIQSFRLILANFINNVYSGNRETLYEELVDYAPFTDRSNLMILCVDCHDYIHSLLYDLNKIIMSQAKYILGSGAETIESIV